jgi:hypothetical protein
MHTTTRVRSISMHMVCSGPVVLSDSSTTDIASVTISWHVGRAL